MNYDTCSNCKHKSFRYDHVHDMVRCKECGVMAPDTSRVDIPFLEMNPALVPLIDFLKPNTLWSWGMGGSPLNDGEYGITLLTRAGNGAEIRWVLPQALNHMLRRAEQQGKDQARAAMRHALGV